MAKGDFERQLSALRLMADMLLTCDNIRLFGFDDQFDIICDLDNYMDDIDDENDAKYLEEIKK